MGDLHETIHRAVRIEWDPIGVADVGDKLDESDAYMPRLDARLRQNASEADLFQYLWTLETEAMGLDGNRQATERFAKRLCEMRTSPEVEARLPDVDQLQDGPPANHSETNSDD